MTNTPHNLGTPKTDGYRTLPSNTDIFSPSVLSVSEHTPRAWGEMSVNEKAVLLGTTNLQTIDAMNKLIQTIEDEAVRRERSRIKNLIPLFTGGEYSAGETSESRRGRNEVLKEIRDLLNDN